MFITTKFSYIFLRQFAERSSDNLSLSVNCIALVFLIAVLFIYFLFLSIGLMFTLNLFSLVSLKFRQFLFQVIQHLAVLMSVLAHNLPWVLLILAFGFNNVIWALGFDSAWLECAL